MERTTEYRGCRIDALVFATSARLKLSTVYQITPLTEQAAGVFGGDWKRIAKAGTTLLRELESSGGDAVHETMESTLRLATQVIDGLFAVAEGEQAKLLEPKERPRTSRQAAS